MLKDLRIGQAMVYMPSKTFIKNKSHKEVEIESSTEESLDETAESIDDEETTLDESLLLSKPDNFVRGIFEKFRKKCREAGESSR